MRSVEEFIGMIWDKRINTSEKDELVWNATKDDLYIVKSSFDVLVGGRGQLLFQKGLFGINWFPQN